MKKIIAGIIAIIWVFSTSGTTFANEPYFEQLLDLNYGVEHYELELSSLDEMYFYDKNMQKMYNDFKKWNTKIKAEIMQYYREGWLSEYQTQGIVRAHKNFVYHTNQIFRHMYYKELDPNYADVDWQILENYRQSRLAYRKIVKVLNTH
jgi:hypothetical protein